LPETPALDRSAAPDAWSAAQVLEHLVLASGSYLAVMRQRVETAAGSDVHDPRWRPTVAGRLLARSMVSARRFPAPRGWRPPLGPRPHVREAWASELRELDALIERAADAPWNRLRFGSPAAALLRLNLGDGFLILVTHAERHHGQIDRALAAAGTEGASPVSADPARTERRT
jgi:uncharacterized damage-inducible protein DinB